MDISSVHLRPLTNALGARLDYGQPRCFLRASWRCMSKDLTAFRSLQRCSALSPARRAILTAAFRSAWVCKPQTTQQNVSVLTCFRRLSLSSFIPL